MMLEFGELPIGEITEHRPVDFGWLVAWPMLDHERRNFTIRRIWISGTNDSPPKCISGAFPGVLV